MSKNLIKFPHISCAVFKLLSQASEHKHVRILQFNRYGDMEIRHLLKASYTVLKHTNEFDLSEEDIDNVNVIVEIVDKFVFNECKELSTMQELQLLEII